MRVIGTAGHVDHGKSTLIEALTGDHPDRLKEEKEREMTIDLGFGWWTLPNGEELGVVDVPGHGDFIENMLAGVGGIDAVLFVVAADEGIMPQTREHLAILNLLKIPAGIVVITKIDMVDDPEWIDLVEEELITALEGTVLSDAPIVRVSAKNGMGLDELQKALSALLKVQPLRPDQGRPRLSIDRTFTITGFGTIATGTLLDGVFRTGDEVEILPAGTKARIRGLQTHKRKVDTVEPGTRTAVNLSGIDLDEIKRGDAAALPGLYTSTGRVDTKFELIADSSHPLKHNDEVKFFVGTAERIARVRLIGAEILNPGEIGWLQIETKEPIVCFRGDRFILRRPSPGETIGGGMILDANPARRYKRFDQQILKKLAALEKGDPQSIILENLSQPVPVPLAELKSSTGLGVEVFDSALANLIKTEAVINLQGKGGQLQPKDLLIGRGSFSVLTRKLIDVLEKYHQDFPLRPGIPQEEIKSRLKLEHRASQALLKIWRTKERLGFENGFVRIAQFSIRFTDSQLAKVDAVLAEFAKNPVQPPTYKACAALANEDIVQALISKGTLKRISQDVVFYYKDFERAVDYLTSWIRENDSITAAQARDALGTTRRYALALLEYMDEQKITRREGDERKLAG